VWALDVRAPVAGGACRGGVYAALSPNPRGREETALGVRIDGSCAIQIWQLVAPTSEEGQSQARERAVELCPELSMLIPMSSALVHALAWCPWHPEPGPGASDAPGIGVLAAGASNGDVTLLWVPQPNAAGLDKHVTAPELARISVGAAGYCTSLHWSPPTQHCDGASVSGHVAAGTTRGSILVVPFVLDPASLRLQVAAAGGGAGGGAGGDGDRGMGAVDLDGAVVLSSSDACEVTSVCWCSPSVLVTGGIDGRIRLWDISQVRV
jgi:WD40 repeat protein